LLRRVLEQSSTALKMERNAALARSLPGLGARRKRNHLGDDLDAGELQEIENVLAGRREGIDAYREAQLRELAFWRWVAFEGYAGMDPRLFPASQERLMVGTFYRTGWTLAEFATAGVFELGCGPLGMIEYIPAARRVAFDPLNPFYARLFARHRSPTVTYIAARPELESLPGDFDLAICHNVIDHTDDPAYWFDGLFARLPMGGRFIFQVNLSRSGVAQPEEHRRMHPAPFDRAQMLRWLEAKSDDFRFDEGETATADGEFPFLAFGRKTRDGRVSYVRPLI
jgi:SAM-dependent methyltransferase